MSEVIAVDSKGTASQKTNKCPECGMETTEGEYHPYAACLMYKQTGDADAVRSNLHAVRATGKMQSARPEPASVCYELNDGYPQDLQFMGVSIQMIKGFKKCMGDSEFNSACNWIKEQLDAHKS